MDLKTEVIQLMDRIDGIRAEIRITEGDCQNLWHEVKVLTGRIDDLFEEMGQNDLC